MKEGRIRPMTQGDVGEVLAIDRAVFSMPWSEESFRTYLHRPEAIFLVAEEPGRITGYASVLVAADQGDIANVAVRAEYRRKKIGSALVEELIRRAKERGVRSLFLEVRKSNTAAIALYTGFGFAPVGERKRYYHDPVEDAVIMCREEGKE